MFVRNIDFTVSNGCERTFCKKLNLSVVVGFFFVNVTFFRSIVMAQNLQTFQNISSKNFTMIYYY